MRLTIDADKDTKVAKNIQVLYKGEELSCIVTSIEIMPKKHLGEFELRKIQQLQNDLREQRGN